MITGIPGGHHAAATKPRGGRCFGLKEITQVRCASLLAFVAWLLTSTCMLSISMKCDRFYRFTTHKQCTYDITMLMPVGPWVQFPLR